MTDFAEAIEQRVIPTSEHAPRLHDHEATILTVAARSFGVDVSAKDEDTWRVGAKASATIDTLVDEKGITDIRGIFDDVVSDYPMGVEGVMSDDEAEELAGFFHTLSPERQNAWREAAISLPDYADRKANAKTIGQLYL